LNKGHDNLSERALILAPQGRDAFVAARILGEARLVCETCDDLRRLLGELARGAGLAVLTEESIRSADIKDLVQWIGSQPPWSDFPFVVLTERGAGVERNPAAERQMEALGNVSFLERPFHPTTLISVVKTALRGRRRQYEARVRLEALHASESHAKRSEAELRRLNETLETRVAERTAEIEATNRQLVSQIEERERIESTLRQMQRLEAVGQLTTGVAHDFNNLLTVVLGNLGFVEKDLGSGLDSRVKQRLSHMRVAAERGAKLTGQLLAFSRRQLLVPKPVDLSETLANMHDLLQSTLGNSVQIKTSFKSDLWRALVDPNQIELAVLNLAINARDASEVGASITLETANATVGPPQNAHEPPAGEHVVVSVTDKGTGMTKEVLAKAFEPFYTTKDIGKGSGLGLSQVLGFAKQSGGGMRIESRVGEGTSVKIYLPRAMRSDVALPSESIGVPKRSVKGAVILLVDDDSAVREVTASILRDLGHMVIEVGSGGGALDLLDRNAHIDLVILDFAMPGMNGMEVARQVRTKAPSRPVVFVTGYADTSAIEDIDDTQIVRKPFIGNELADKVQTALANSAGNSSNKIIRLRR
jgi:signal transduction histidine kinase/ActR/RegA family two-component response regulator